MALQDVISRYENLVLKHDSYVKEHDDEDETLKAYHQREKLLMSNINTLQTILVLLSAVPYLIITWLTTAR